MIDRVLLLFFLYTSGSNGFFPFEQLSSDLQRSKRSSHAEIESLPIEIQTISQTLDHFNTSENRQWSMRYYERLDMWKPGGPILMYAGGEDVMHKFVIAWGLIVDLASEINGALFSPEHRYYGIQGYTPLDIINSYEYLSSRQTIEDMAHLIRTLKASPRFQNSKVIMFGSSYSASLAAWMRFLHPELVDAAHASGSAIRMKLDCNEYLDTVSRDYLKYGGIQCYTKIKNQFRRYTEQFKTAHGIEQLKMENNICQITDMSKPENQYVFKYATLNPFMKSTQFDSPMEVRKHCAAIDNNIWWHSLNGSRYAILNETNGQCDDFDYETQFVQNQSLSEILWTYQRCSEFGFFLTSSSDKLFGDLPIEFYLKQCLDRFGFTSSQVNDALERTNKFYETPWPQVTRVSYVGGEKDPWHQIGPLEDLNKEAPAFIIPDGFHCEDLDPGSPYDSVAVREVRKKVKSLLKSWIGM